MRRFLIPEAIQTSAMDCGPASLKALLEGFGIPVSYGRLREACQTDVDGTSIDQIEEAAKQLGLDATQIMLPLDHLFLSGASALPAIIVVRQPDGQTHFVVAWRKVGPWVQIMDPAVGRRWALTSRFAETVYEHAQPIPAETWRGWAGSGDFLGPLRRRISRLGAGPGPYIDTALADPSHHTLARLDAATRMTERLTHAGALDRGPEAAAVLGKLATGGLPVLPEYWSAGAVEKDPESVLLRGAVLVSATGRLATASTSALSPELAAALHERQPDPARELWRAVRQEGLLQPAFLGVALFLAAAGAVVETVLLRGFFDLARYLQPTSQRLAGISALLVFSGALLLLDFLLAGSILRTGRRLEGRLRVQFLRKIPRLNDRYFQSRPISDMAERCHTVHQLRQVPELASNFLRSVFGMVCAVAAIGWLYPGSLWPAIGVAAIALGVPWFSRPALAERDLRLRSHSGALTRFYLDGLLGLTAIRAHAGERAVRNEQLALLREWARAGFGLQRLVVTIEGLQFGLSLAAAAWLVWRSVGHGGEIGGTLLLVYWVLNLPVLGEEAAAAIWQYPMQRNAALRFAEPLGAPEEPVPDALPAQQSGAAAIRLHEVTVRAAGNLILENISLDVPAGAHVAIVGSSGAGKSSLVGLLLGWHRAASGSVEVDGTPLDAQALSQLRGQTAWIDPQVQIWNRSLYDNLLYGSEDVTPALDAILEAAELRTVLSKLPDGMQTVLGEGGALVSGGEGQRVRFGRAMSRPDPRLVILDEPARGLDYGLRRALLDRARERWRNATLLCITHDVASTQSFDRVVVIHRGNIAQDGHPRELLAQPESRYRELLEAEDSLRHGLWASSNWRRVRMQSGKLVELEGKPARAEASA